jgi:Tfp pilus assembly protein PilE
MALETAISYLEHGTGVTCVFLLILIILVGVLAFIRRSQRQSLSQKSKHSNHADAFYVSIAYTMDRDTETPRQGYLRSLTADRATLVVTDRSLRKGSQLRLDLAQLRNDCGGLHRQVLGRVTQTKKLVGTQNNTLVDIQFLEHNVLLDKIRQSSGNVSSS